MGFLADPAHGPTDGHRFPARGGQQAGSLARATNGNLPTAAVRGRPTAILRREGIYGRLDPSFVSRYLAFARDHGAVNRQGPKSRVSGLLIVATSVLVAVLVWPPASAAAHGGDGSMDVQSSAQTGPNTFRLEVSVPYPDGDLADNATVRAKLNGPGGTVLPSVAVPRKATGYAADLSVTGPGIWRVAVSSVNPVAEATVEVNIKDGGSVLPTDVRAPSAPDKPGRGGRLAPLITAVGVAGLGCGVLVRRRAKTRSMNRGEV